MENCGNFMRIEKETGKEQKKRHKKMKKKIDKLKCDVKKTSIDFWNI